MESSSQQISFAKDIRPLFTDTDVLHMKPYGFDLSNYEDVVANAQAIHDAVSGGTMPPKANGGPWTKEKCDLFERWMQQGHVP